MCMYIHNRKIQSYINLNVGCGHALRSTGTQPSEATRTMSYVCPKHFHNYPPPPNPDLCPMIDSSSSMKMVEGA